MRPPPEFLSIPEPDGTGLTTDDALFLAQHIEVPDHETDDSWLALEYIEEICEETEEQRKATITKIIGELQSEEEEIPGERISGQPHHEDGGEGPR